MTDETDAGATSKVTPARKPKPPTYDPLVRHAVTVDAEHTLRGPHGRTPARQVIAWRLNGFGRIDPDNASEFEVTFAADGPGRTRVCVEHPHFDRMGTKHAKRVRNGMDKRWPVLLSGFGAHVATVQR